MKLKSKVYAVLTIVLVTLLPLGCAQKSKSKDTGNLKAYKKAQLAQDYVAAVPLLLKLVNEDSAAYVWAYDSLAFYHYFYLITPGVVRNTYTPKYYAQRGLDINPENSFLSEIKAKLELEDQNIQIAQGIFQRLWKKTNDYTYLWILTYMDALDKNGMTSADSVITIALGNPETEGKTVRLDFPQERIRETIPANAAFIYLRASFLLDKGNVMEATNLLNEALKIVPNFYGAKRLVYMIQQGGQKQ
jgi:tetratricopeptide (TPR) repeat protein